MPIVYFLYGLGVVLFASALALVGYDERKTTDEQIFSIFVLGAVFIFIGACLHAYLGTYWVAS